MKTPFTVILLTLAINAASAAGSDKDGLPEGVSPWWPSRYGEQDQIGTLNEITAKRIVSAARLVKIGAVLDLGRILDDDTPKFPGRYWRQTADVSAIFANRRRPDANGKSWGKNHINWITEIQAGTFQVGTQLDSIGHIQIGDRFYNGLTADEVVEPWGLNRYGIETVPPVITRGVLIDVAAYKGVDRLHLGYAISLADVKGALSRQEISLQASDAVLIHTGWGALYGKDNDEFLAGEPGLGMEAVDWLYRQRIAITGADTWSYGPVP
ncbi:MAG: cyclase family protein, partial [Gammaproteobacteria bacterium]